jgi:hypothetical protein
MEAIGISSDAPNVDHIPAIISDIVEIEVTNLSEPPATSRINGGDVHDVNHNDLKSVLLVKEVEVKYVKKGDNLDKLRKELEQLDLNNHLWHLKSWDDKDVPVVKLHCGECKKDFGGDSGDHSKCAIYNLFNNFKKSHILSILYIRAWCKQKGISFDNHPQTSSDKAVALTTSDHKALVDEGLHVLKKINDDICADVPTFLLIGDPAFEQLKSF